MAKGILLDTSQLRPQPRGELCGLSLYLKYAKFCDLSGQIASHSLQAVGHWSLLPDPPALLPARVSSRHTHPCMAILAPGPQRISSLLLGLTFPGTRGPHRVCPLRSTHLATSGPCLNCPALPAAAFLGCCLPLGYDPALPLLAPQVSSPLSAITTHPGRDTGPVPMGPGEQTSAPLCPLCSLVTRTGVVHLD